MNGLMSDLGTAFMGNANLKRVGIPYSFTKEQVEEFIKCSQDPIYFIKKYIKIVTLDHGVQPFTLYPYQEKLINSLWKNRFSLGVWARQMGKTTTVAAFIIWFAIFTDHKTIGILANKASMAREILHRIQFAYELLPLWLQQGVKEWNKGSIELENGSVIFTAATSSSAARGRTIDFLLLDEFAFLSTNIADDFFASVYPTISSGKSSKMAIISTPNGLNHFHKMVKEAEAGVNSYHLQKATWREVPGRDEKWAQENRAILGELKFRQEMECEFLGSSGTLISPDVISAIPIEKPFKETESTKIYVEPKPGHDYVITVDTSRGTGGDYSAFVVFDVSVLPFEVVARFRDNKISTMFYPQVTLQMANKYNNAYILIENNDMGESVSQTLYYEYEYENVLLSKDNEISMFRGIPGFKTTKKSKAVGCNAIKNIVENNKIIIRDSEILSEMSNFVSIGNSFAAENGHDDLMMCLVMFGYLTTQPAFQDITDVDARKKIIEEKENLVENEMLPAGFLNDGLEENAFF